MKTLRYVPSLFNINDSLLREGNFQNDWLKEIFQIYPDISLHLGVFMKQKKTVSHTWIVKPSIKHAAAIIFQNFGKGVTPWSSAQCLPRLRNGVKNYDCFIVQLITIIAAQYLHAKLSKGAEIQYVTHWTHSKDGYWPQRTHNIKDKQKQQTQEPWCMSLPPSLPAHRVPPLPNRPLQSCFLSKYPKPLLILQGESINFPR